MNTLRNGAPVTITRWRYAGYRGRVVHRDRYDRFYELELTHDPAGKRLPQPFKHGLYARKELEHRANDLRTSA